MDDLRILPAGDSALLVQAASRIDVATSEHVVALAAAVRERCKGRLRDVVVGYCSLALYFDPLLTDTTWLEEEVRALDAGLPDRAVVEGAVIDVPVCYGGAYGPDLAAVAMSANTSESDVVALHAGVTYRVYMVGFVPGFAYMASVDSRIAVPRRGTPRTRVPEGSVAIAAGQTAIYPIETPGGWHLIGRTRVKPFDPSRDEPCLFKAGDRVRFHPVDRVEFERA